jgi:hypothetical protein
LITSLWAGWSRRSRLWIVATSLLLAGPVQAGLSLQLQTERLTAPQQAASQALLDEALATLPPRMVQELDRPVRVRWVEDLPHKAYGRASQPTLLDLNARLLPALTDGSAAEQQTGRPHRTLRRELLATVVHELAHIYDRQRAWSPDERRQLQRCRMLSNTLGDAGIPGACRGQSARRYTLSDDPRLLDLAGWPQQVGRRGQREQENRQLARSPDLYELYNPREFVAVNLEYFLLDPDYACRRPALQRYLRAHFDWAPAQSTVCPDAYPYMNAGLEADREALGQLDPERVYEVDYLLAEPNQNWVSRWGHSMLRLVICAPGRPRGPDCRLDLDQHLVLSYRAFVGDVQLSSWDGLTGAYPSRLFILPLAQVIDEYTKVELRSLASVPLRLPRPELEALVEHAAELHWGYDGSYFFISNNCAVETLKLLRSGTGHDSLQTLDSITPTGLLQLLEARGLADHSVLQDPREALRLGYRFDSFRERYQTMFSVLREHLPVPQTQVEDWLTSPADSRQLWIERADLRTSAALLLLEQAALRGQLQLAQEDLKQRYLSQRDGVKGDMADAGGTLEQILANSGFLSRPAELLEGGYGLPQTSEWEQLKQSSDQRQAVLRSLTGNLDQELRNLLKPERRAELEAGERNIKQLSEHLRRLHKAAGGLVL